MNVYDMKSIVQSSQWKRPEGPTLEKERQVGSNGKSFLTIFFDCNGVRHHEFLPQSRTVNKEHFLGVMARLRVVIRQKRIELWKIESWILQHAQAHPSMLVHEFLAKKKKKNHNHASITGLGPR